MIRLTKGETPAEVPVLLPDGETIYVSVGYSNDYAYCIKEAGDDPDVTNGIEVRASVKQIANGKQPTANIEILGGEGVGHFTLPGFDYPPGEPAINKAPREMIRQNLEQLSTVICQLSITISVPNGEEIARRTFNPRLGIEGGISIIGVSGIVKPFSEEAFISSIRKCMEVAKASGTDRVVINSGAKSERFLKDHYPHLPSQAFVQYGNYIGETLKIADELQFEKVTLGVMLGKAVKLAAGHLDTHSRKATMDKVFIQQMLDESNCQLSIINCQLSLARELWEILPKEKIEDFCRVVIQHCMQHCQPLVPHTELTLLLIDDDGTIHPQ
jgi:cobalamin biosynthesis protein CbiD